MLWVGLHFPSLSLESCAAGLPQALRDAGQPMALVDAHRIACADAKAQALGVSAGMKRATALSLAPHLLLGQADAWRDAQALQAAAFAALAFTPMVCTVPPDGVLLEVQASLRYFGGLAALLGRLKDALAPLGHRLQAASAPTAHGAVLLARWHDGLECPDRRALQPVLERAPLALLASAGAYQDTLAGMGLRCLADLRPLPRAGLARRFGKELLDEIDRAFGDRPDPREPLVLPPVFRSELELFARADTTEQLLHGAQMLLLRLVAWLSAQHAFVTRFTLTMKHEARWRDGGIASATTLDLALAEPSRDAAHMLTLLRERLAHVQLPAPTLELVMESSDVVRRPPPNAELFPTPHSERAGLIQLIERLQARLGREQVQCLRAVADHRPERATEVLPADPLLMKSVPGARGLREATPPVPKGPFTRPLWLLQEPQPLQDRQSHPVLDGHLVQLLAGPERIEAGWWDGGLAERDYFIGRTAGGALVWLYRKRVQPLSSSCMPSGHTSSSHTPSNHTQGWYLHGRFA